MSRKLPQGMLEQTGQTFYFISLNIRLSFESLEKNYTTSFLPFACCELQ